MQSDLGKPNRSTDATPTTDDSGLHDIRAMAQTTRQRNSRRITTQAPVDDLVSSSVSMRAIALPDPTRLSVPNLAIPAPLPAAVPSREMAPSSVPARPSGRLASASIAAPIVAPTAAVAAPAVAAPARVSAIEELASLARAKAPKPTSSKKPYLIAGAILAVGGGVAAFVAMRPGAAPASPPVVAAPVVVPLEAPPAATPPAPPVPAAVPVAEVAAVPAAIVDEAPAARDSDKPKETTKPKGAEVVAAVAPTPPVVAEVAPKVEPAPKATGEGKSIDDLLAAAGAAPGGGDDEIKPEKKSLTSGDIKGVMVGYKGKAQGCYDKHGVSGNVTVKLSVTPDGKVKSSSATGSFAGTPTGECVSKLVSGATFPAWDGAVMTVNFTYLLEG